MSNTKRNYDVLATRLTALDQPIKGSETAAGAAAAQIGREFLVREYGSNEAVEAAVLTRGRPRVGQAIGASPTVRARISRNDYDAMKRLEAATGRSQSDLVREAVHQLLVQHKMVG